MLHSYPLFTTYKLIIKRKCLLCNIKLLFAQGVHARFLSILAPNGRISLIIPSFLVILPINSTKI